MVQEVAIISIALLKTIQSKTRVAEQRCGFEEGWNSIRAGLRHYAASGPVVRSDEASAWSHAPDSPVAIAVWSVAV